MQVGKPLVGNGLGDHIAQMPWITSITLADPAGPVGQHHQQWIQRLVLILVGRCTGGKSKY